MTTHREREMFRSHVPDELDLQVEIITPDHQIWRAKCCNLSSGGLFVKFPAKNIPEASVDDKVDVKIQFLDSMALLDGIVRSNQNGYMGILITNEKENPKKGSGKNYLNIVGGVERAFLRRRANQRQQ